MNAESDKARPDAEIVRTALALFRDYFVMYDESERRAPGISPGIARAEDALAALGRIEETLRRTATRKDGDGIECWCASEPILRSGLFASSHAEYCLDARAALASPTTEEAA